MEIFLGVDDEENIVAISISSHVRIFRTIGMCCYQRPLQIRERRSFVYAKYFCNQITLASWHLHSNSSWYNEWYESDRIGSSMKMEPIDDSLVETEILVVSRLLPGFTKAEENDVYVGCSLWKLFGNCSMVYGYEMMKWRPSRCIKVEYRGKIRLNPRERSPKKKNTISNCLYNRFSYADVAGSVCVCYSILRESNLNDTTLHDV